MDDAQAREEDAVAPPSPVVIGSATYLGGHRKLGDHRLRHLRITVDEHGWTITQSVQADVWGRQLRENRLCSIPWEAVRAVEVEVDGRQAATRRFPAGGVLGALRSKKNVSLLVRTVDGEAAFELHSRHPERIGAELSPWTRARPERGSQAPAVSPTTSADAALRRLRELGDLRDRGVLAPDEFERLKSQLLSELP